MKKLALAAILAGSTATAAAGYAFADHHRGGHHGKMIEKLDTDGDGQITKAEVEALKAEKFAEADANGDGGLTLQEIEAFRKAERERRREARKQARFDRADTNGDGVISVDEFDARGGKMFDHADANDDGIITAEEIEAMKEKRGKRGWHRRHGGPEDGTPEE